MRPKLTAVRLREVLNYDPKTGHFTWRGSGKGRKTGAGGVAGRLSPWGYWCIGIDYRDYRAGRLAWFWMTGEWPPEQIDHINGDRVDNAWCNLRLAHSRDNQRNKGITKANTSGFKGVSRSEWKTKSGWKNRWRAVIMVDGKKLDLGSYDAPEVAAAAYAEAAIKYFAEFARIA